MPHKNLSHTDLSIVSSILNKFQKNYRRHDINTLTIEQLRSFLSNEEWAFLKKTTRLDTTAPNDLNEQELIAPYRFSLYGRRFVRVYPPIWDAFCALERQVEDATGQKLYIISGYRSSAYQAIIKLRGVYQENQPPLVELPNKSEHGRLPWHAIDISEQRNRFRLSKNVARVVARQAPKIGFTVSYPEGNGTGIQPEPWHLRYKNRSGTT